MGKEWLQNGENAKDHFSEKPKILGFLFAKTKQCPKKKILPSIWFSVLPLEIFWAMIWNLDTQNVFAIAHVSVQMLTSAVYTFWEKNIAFPRQKCFMQCFCLGLRCQLEMKGHRAMVLWFENSASPSFLILPWENETERTQNHHFPIFFPPKNKLLSTDIGLSNFIPITTFRLILPRFYRMNQWKIDSTKRLKCERCAYLMRNGE